MLTGKFNAERIVALVGSSIKKPRYFVTKLGCEMATMLFDHGIEKEAHVRIISGNILSGKQVNPDGYLDYYSNTITVIPEGDDYEFFGWTAPVFNKVSTTRALTFSWLFPNKKYDLNTNTNGEHRAFVTTGNYEEVFPLDIFPMQILKACMYNDLDEMEEGLIKITKKYLDTNSFYYSPGQVITSEDALVLLGRELTDKELVDARKVDPNFENIGINPILVNAKKPEDSKVYLSTMIEQDYFRIGSGNKKEIDTIAIGFGMNQVYELPNGKRISITNAEQMEYANKIKSPAVILYGEDEIKSGKPTLRDLNSGNEKSNLK